MVFFFRVRPDGRIVIPATHLSRISSFTKLNNKACPRCCRRSCKVEQVVSSHSYFCPAYRFATSQTRWTHRRYGRLHGAKCSHNFNSNFVQPRRVCCPPQPVYVQATILVSFMQSVVSVHIESLYMIIRRPSHLTTLDFPPPPPWQARRRQTMQEQGSPSKGAWACVVCKRQNEPASKACWVCYTARWHGIYAMPSGQRESVYRPTKA